MGKDEEFVDRLVNDLEKYEAKCQELLGSCSETDYPGKISDACDQLELLEVGRLGGYAAAALLALSHTATPNSPALEKLKRVTF